MGYLGIASIVILIIILVILVSCIRVVGQMQAMVVERLGLFRATWSSGLHIKLPIVDKIVKKVDLKEQVVTFEPQPFITKDNAAMLTDMVVFFQITDPKLFCYGVSNPIMAIESLAATTLRSLIADLEFDRIFTSIEVTSIRLRESLDIAANPFGIRVNRVELKNSRKGN